MLNGTPSRLSMMSDFMAHVVPSSLRNAEATVALVQMAEPRLLCAPTTRRDILLKRVSRDEVAQTLKSAVDLESTLKIANLTLKHRRDPRQRQRVVVFVGSPLSSGISDKVNTACEVLRKNGAKLDVIHMPDPTGVASADPTVLQQCVQLMGEGSRYVSVPRGMNALDYCISSGVFQAESDEQMEEVDPDLAMAIRMSLMDQGGAGAPAAAAPETPALIDEDAPMTEEEQIRRAMELSMMDAEATPLIAETDGDDGDLYDDMNVTGGTVPLGDEEVADVVLTEDEEVELAIGLSMGRGYDDIVRDILGKR